MYFETEATWFLLNTLLDWVKVLAATHIGFRLVGAYAGRVRLGSGQRALQGRVRELEQATEELRGQLEEVLEAERFATALRQTSSERLGVRAGMRIPLLLGLLSGALGVPGSSAGAQTSAQDGDKLSRASQAPSSMNQYYEAERRAKRPALLAQLAAARDRWRAVASHDMRYRVRVRCFCVVSPKYVTVVARGDSALLVVDPFGRRTQQLSPLEVLPSPRELFSQAGAAIRGAAEEIDVTFDPTFGLPTRIYTNPRVNFTDDELDVVVSHLSRTPRH